MNAEMKLRMMEEVLKQKNLTRGQKITLMETMDDGIDTGKIARRMNSAKRKNWDMVIKQNDIKKLFNELQKDNILEPHEYNEIMERFFNLKEEHAYLKLGTAEVLQYIKEVAKNASGPMTAREIANEIGLEKVNAKRVSAVMRYGKDELKTKTTTKVIKYTVELEKEVNVYSF